MTMENFEQRIKNIEEQLEDLKRNKPEDQLSMVVFSGDLDRMLAAFIIAVGAVAMYERVVMFFTFWGLQRLKKGGLEKGPLSKMNMLGLGKWMVKRKMKQANVVSLEKMMQDFKELGGKILACDMTMDIMGIKVEDLREDLISNYCGVGTYLDDARNSKITLFIS